MTVVESAALTAAIPSPRTPLPAESSGGRAPAAGTGRHVRRRRLVRWLLGAALGLSFALTCLLVGLPTDRVVLLGWVVAGLTLYAVVDGPRRVGRLLVDWLPLVALLLAYDASRGLADGFGATVHVAELATADRWLSGGSLPTVVLQQHWQADWWKAVASLVYASHFVVTPVVLGVLWIRDRDRWKTFAGLVVGLSAAGLLTYVLYPAAPPWLAAKDGVIEPVRRLSGAGWEVLGLPRAGALLADSQGQVNQVAAVPSCTPPSPSSSAWCCCRSRAGTGSASCCWATGRGWRSCWCGPGALRGRHPAGRGVRGRGRRRGGAVAGLATADRSLSGNGCRRAGRRPDRGRVTPTVYG
ncbi:phosphatase PAP2 family protein [Blastococcus brunescens]|uniref:Phosphatase PAP2 family protein n=1 Tax=Blastococcus brunescens TaxID=1564165 RepID=A0ABZ1AYJ0_9ACTN|nr:phosphatase PAP2 family protein [Blastococcus sp. BMG 8361]WRL61870.1 phosphatase PAP2 family protein [Blastococcus sp. BMG 8361]